MISAMKVTKARLPTAAPPITAAEGVLCFAGGVGEEEELEESCEAVEEYSIFIVSILEIIGDC